jgi:hypothetical protein
VCSSTRTHTSAQRARQGKATRYTANKGRWPGSLGLGEFGSIARATGMDLLGRVWHLGYSVLKARGSAAIHLDTRDRKRLQLRYRHTRTHTALPRLITLSPLPLTYTARAAVFLPLHACSPAAALCSPFCYTYIHYFSLLPSIPYTSNGPYTHSAPLLSPSPSHTHDVSTHLKPPASLPFHHLKPRQTLLPPPQATIPPICCIVRLHATAASKKSHSPPILATL